MSFKTEETVIGEFTYKVTQLDAVRGRRAFVRLMKVAGPVLEGNLDAALDKLTEADFDYFCDLFAKTTQVHGPDMKEGAWPYLSDIFAVHFAGRYLEMMRWLAFALGVNFSSFFGGIGDAIKELGEKANALQSPKASTGTSGAS